MRLKITRLNGKLPSVVDTDTGVLIEVVISTTVSLTINGCEALIRLAEFDLDVEVEPDHIIFERPSENEPPF